MEQETPRHDSRQSQDQAVLDRFEHAWQEGLRPKIQDFLPADPTSPGDTAARHELLVELVILDLWYQWRLAAGPAVTPDSSTRLADPSDLQNGGPAASPSKALLLEDYVHALPELGAFSNLPVHLILEEYRTRLRWEAGVSEAEYVARFPAYARELPAWLQAVRGAGDATLPFVSTVPSPAEQGERAAAVGSSTSAGTRFRILRPHKEGGLGKVSVARDEELQREVAIKEIKARHANDPDSRARFLLEAEITGGLEHPGIIPVYGLGQYGDGRPFYAMRFIRGDSLQEAADRYHNPTAAKSASGKRAVELRKLLGRFLIVCNAIDYAHSRGVLHRDLKPGNIMLGPYGETLVVDWGLAKAVDRLEPHSASIEGLLRPPSGSTAATQMGFALGTPQYMSPEQATGRLDLLAAASDVYSLGATLYYVLTGRPPIESKDVRDVLKKVERGEFPRPRAVNPQIARPLEAICLKAMALARADRYATPKALADDIEHWLADEPIAAYREPAPARAARWGRKHKVLVAGLFGLVTAAALSLAVATALIQKALSNESAALNNAQRQLALSYVDHGVYELEHGGPRQGLAILGQAYRAATAAHSLELRRSVCALAGAWQPMIAHHLGRAGVTAMAFSPDGSKLATAGNDYKVRLWDAATGQPLGQPMSHDSVVNVLAFSADGRTLATASGNLLLSQSGEHRLWDAATGQPLGTPVKHEGVVNLLVFSPSGTKVAMAESLGMVTEHRTGKHRLWDALSGKPLGPPLLHASEVDAMSFSADGTKIATAGGLLGPLPSGEVRLWDAETGQPLAPSMPSDAPVTSVAFSPDGAKIAAGSPNVARLWDLKTFRPLGPPMKLNSSAADAPCSVAFDPDGTTLATSSVDGTRLWDAATCRPLGDLLKHGRNLTFAGAAAFSPDGTTLATAEGDDGARLWDVATGKPLDLPVIHDSAVKSVAFSPDGTKLTTFSEEGTVGVWDLAVVLMQVAPQKHNGRLLAVAFSPDGSKVATASDDRTARLWNAKTGQPLGQPMKHNGEVNSVVFSPDGAKVATTSLDKTARLWDASSGQSLGPPLEHDDSVVAAAFSPDGRKLVTTSLNMTTRLWDVATGRPLCPPMRHDDGILEAVFSSDGAIVTTVSWSETRRWDAATGLPLGTSMKRDGLASLARVSPDGKKLVTVCVGTVQLWDPATGQPLAAPMTHEDTVVAVAFSADSSKLATASHDKTARVWNATTGQPVGLSMKHDGKVYSIAFSPDGARVATGSVNGARLWDAATGQPLGLRMKHDGMVVSLAFSPDGRQLVTASHDKTGRIWPVPLSLPDDPQWLPAYLRLLSGWQEDAESTIHPISEPQAQEAWQEALRSPACLDQERHDARQAARAWHESDAAAEEATGAWFAAAFHLRCLCQLESGNTVWPQRLAKAREHLAGPAQGAAGSHDAGPHETGRGTPGP